MELKLKEDRFYLLDADGEKRIFDDENDSARALETMASQKDDMDESLNVLKVNKAEEGWKIEPVPWSRIVIWESAKTRGKKRKPRLFDAEIRIRNPFF